LKVIKIVWIKNALLINQPTDHPPAQLGNTYTSVPVLKNNDMHLNVLSNTLECPSTVNRDIAILFDKTSDRKSAKQKCISHKSASARAKQTIYISFNGTTLIFYEPDVLPATQPTMSKHYRKTQWFDRLLF